jgi:DNA repair protein RadC
MKTLTKQLAEIKVSYHPKRVSNVKIDSSQSAYTVLKELFDPGLINYREEFIVLYLNRANNILGWIRASVGGLTSTIADPRFILSTALKSAAVGVILAHNHPSGNLKPSYHDEELTKKINEGAMWLDIKLLDHIILSPFGQYLSMADEGLI